jgi:hypothetical protein
VIGTGPSDSARWMKKGSLFFASNYKIVLTMGFYLVFFFVHGIIYKWTLDYPILCGGEFL